MYLINCNNISGEHIDYCGYAVHPMAIDQDILVAAAKNKTSNDIVIANVNSQKYNEYKADISKVRHRSLSLSRKYVSQTLKMCHATSSNP